MPTKTKTKTKTKTTTKRHAVGIVRVSRVGEREGESFVSPTEQADRIAAECKRQGLELIDVVHERDVSGGTPLAKRHGLRSAVERIEAGEAGVLVVAYMDRLVRSLAVQLEVVERVEAAGGEVLTADHGKLTNGSAASKLSGHMLGIIAAYQRDTVAERTQEAKRRAVERGVPPFPNIPSGLRKRVEDGRLEPDPETAPVVLRAFERRARGATIAEVRAFLREHGIGLSVHGVRALLKSRIMLGELRFGETVNERSHAPIVPLELFERVQRLRLPRGRRAKSDRLLARLGVLRCGTCGARMVVCTSRQGGKDYAFYRCPPAGSDCPRRVTISATVAEAAVVEAVQSLLADVEGRASIEGGVQDAERELEMRQDELDRAIGAFSVVADEPSAQERLAELREARDAARDRLAELVDATVPAIVVTAGDWDDLTVDERRALIRATIAEAVVKPGRGPDRITVKPRS